MIKAQNLQKKFGEKTAVDNISFSVKEGEIFGFLGPNGAGKSTTIRILTGQLLPGYGFATVAGKDAVRERDALHSLIGVVPENTNLYERLTVAQNLELFCKLYGCSTKVIGNYLEQVGMTASKNIQVKKLSKGMKQKILLIRALLHEPRLLFLDEPSSGLDPSSADAIHKLLKSLNDKGVTILLTSHNMEEVDKLCHRVAFLDNGKIAAEGSPGELKLQHSENRMKVLLSQGDSLMEETISLTGADSAARLSEWMQAGRVKAVHSCEPTLAEIFVKLTGREFQ